MDQVPGELHPPVGNPAMGGRYCRFGSWDAAVGGSDMAGERDQRRFQFRSRVQGRESHRGAQEATTIVCACVLREGQEERILSEELVPGDVILLAEGDRISADARLVEENEIRVDQSTLKRRIAPGAQDEFSRLEGGPDSR